jgi:hypothetical protein
MARWPGATLSHKNVGWHLCKIKTYVDIISGIDYVNKAVPLLEK